MSHIRIPSNQSVDTYASLVSSVCRRLAISEQAQSFIQNDIAQAKAEGIRALFVRLAHHARKMVIALCIGLGEHRLGQIDLRRGQGDYPHDWFLSDLPVCRALLQNETCLQALKHLRLKLHPSSGENPISMLDTLCKLTSFKTLQIWLFNYAEDAFDLTLGDDLPKLCALERVHYKTLTCGSTRLAGCFLHVLSENWTWGQEDAAWSPEARGFLFDLIADEQMSKYVCSLVLDRHGDIKRTDPSQDSLDLRQESCALFSHHVSVTGRAQSCTDCDIHALMSRQPLRFQGSSIESHARSRVLAFCTRVRRLRLVMSTEGLDWIWTYFKSNPGILRPLRSFQRP